MANRAVCACWRVTFENLFDVGESSACTHDDRAGEVHMLIGDAQPSCSPTGHDGQGYPGLDVHRFDNVLVAGICVILQQVSPLAIRLTSPSNRGSRRCSYSHGYRLSARDRQVMVRVNRGLPANTAHHSSLALASATVDDSRQPR